MRLCTAITAAELREYIVAINVCADCAAWLTPGLFFVYDLSPFQVTIEETRQPLSQFLINICAIIGRFYRVKRTTCRIGALSYRLIADI